MTKEDPLSSEKKSKDETAKKAAAQTPSESFNVSIDDNVNISPPSYQKVERGGNNEDEGKSCRICLEDDDPGDMIAPCQCRGGSKWVHRRCLDQWRIHETDRAFSKCTECLFDYHLQPISNNSSSSQMMIRRRAKYVLMVSRDLCMATLSLQAVIALLGWVVSWMDPDRSLPAYINPNYPVAVYYLFGFLVLLVLLGIFGTMMLCQHGCSVKGSLEQFPAVHPLGARSSSRSEVGEAAREYQPTYAERSGYYHSRRQRNQSRRDACDNCCDGCCIGRYHYPSVYYYGDPGPCFYCCCCCDDETSSAGGANTASRSVQAGGDDCGDCDCCHSSDGGGGGDCGEAFLVFLVVLAIFMAIIGFLVGIIIIVVIFQRTVQRHIYILHKRQLTNEFQVMDLSGYDLEQPLPGAAVPETSSTNGDAEPTNSNKNEKEVHCHPLPSAPPLPEKDSAYLKNLGLME